MSTQSTKRRELLNEIDVCVEKLSELIVQVRIQASRARREGDQKKVDQLHEVNRENTLAIATLRRRQLKLLDTSPEMQDAIAGFKKVNKDIADAIKETKDLAKFLNAVATIAGVLGKIIKLALIP